jgi:uncharacterized protein (TIGR03663 family)
MYFYIVFSAILLSAAYLCFSDLTVRPMHHDEGVYGWFRLNIYNACLGPDAPGLGYEDYAAVCSGQKAGAFCQMGYPLGPLTRYSEICGRSYSYDPQFHGPFSFIMGAWVFLVFGVSDYTLRAPDCVFQLGSIILLLLLRKRMGSAGVLFSAALIAFSPAMVYYSKHAYFDPFFSFFTLGSVVCASKFLETGKKRWLYVGSANLGLLFTVKEGAAIFAAIGGAYLLVWFLLARVRPGKRKGTVIKKKAHSITLYSALLSVGIFALVCAFFYSNMFMNLSLLPKAINGISFWLEKTHTWTGHFKPFDYFLRLLLEYEIAIVLSSLAAALCLKDGWARWCLFWALSSLMIYSVNPYKTPVNLITIILPLALLSGTGLNDLTERLSGWKKCLPAAVLFPLLAYSLMTAWDVSFVHYADPDNRLAYVTSLPSYSAMIKDITGKADQFNGKSTVIAINVNDYWPLPWSLRDYKLLYGMDPTSPPIVISDKGDYSDIKLEARAKYLPPKRYEMREWVYAYVYYWKANQTEG